MKTWFALLAKPKSCLQHNFPHTPIERGSLGRKSIYTSILKPQLVLMFPIPSAPPSPRSEYYKGDDELSDLQANIIDLREVF